MMPGGLGMGVVWRGDEALYGNHDLRLGGGIVGAQHNPIPSIAQLDDSGCDHGRH